jgi:threonyl-tRNA synthetase
MNCPHHHLIFASRPRSYRALPLRLAEYGQIYRHENSGSLHGLSRVRGLCQNDAHIYVDKEDAEEEIVRVLRLHEHCYRALGLSGYRYRLSKHDPGSLASHEGAADQWQASEAILRRALVRLVLPFFEAEGEAAFYGPKIDVQMRIGKKEESIASVQLDFLSAARFDLSFMGRAGEKRRPWVIHRAPLGSHERFVAMLLEHFQGRLPAWLCPVQLFVLPLSEELLPSAKELVDELVAAGLRAKLDESNGSLAKRIRAAHRLRPFALLVLGPKEAESGRLRLQLRGESHDVWRVNLAAELRRLIVRPSPLA